jgi:hypothetical protein
VRGRRFKSCHPDQYFQDMMKWYHPTFGAWKRKFDSFYPDQINNIPKRYIMNQINELQTNELVTEERTQDILKELDRIQRSLAQNDIEVKKAIKILEAELKERQNAA